MSDNNRPNEALPQYSYRAALCATALAFEFPSFDQTELTNYCQAALIQAYNPVSRPWECLPLRGENGVVTLWPNHPTVIYDGQAVFESKQIQWQWIDKGSIVAPSDEQIEKYRLQQGDVLYRAAIEHNSALVQWQAAVGRLLSMKWPMDVARQEAGPKPGWALAEGFAVIRAGETIFGEDNGRTRHDVGYLRALRQLWLGLVAPADMTAVRRRRLRDLDAEVDNDLEREIGKSPHTTAPLRQSESNLASEKPFG